jgi:hypothetical protein
MRALVSYLPIPNGDAGAVATLQVMRNLVEDARRDVWAVREARTLVDADPTDDADTVIGRIAEVMRERFQFGADPFAVDRVSSPVLLLWELRGRGVIRGDCDDAAVLVAYLGTVYGIGYRFRAVGFQLDGPLSHVFTVLRGTTEPIPLDVTANAKQVVPAARRVLDYP